MSKPDLEKIIAPHAEKFARMIGENRQTIDNYISGGIRRGEFLKKLAEKISMLSGS